MAQLQGTVVSVQMDVAVKKNGGGTYPGWRLVYTAPDGSVKTLEKHMNTVKFDAVLNNSLRSLQPNDPIVIVLEKNGQFNEVKSITKGDAAPAGLQQNERPVAEKATSTGYSAGSTRGSYESAEERERRQVLIVRQSSLAQAIAKNKDASDEEILARAKAYFHWCMTGEISDTLIKNKKSIRQQAAEIAQKDDIPQ